MLKKAYSIRDNKGNIYSNPMFSLTHGEAERNFKSAINDTRENNIYNQYPEDFALYHLGDYDDVTGLFQPKTAPEKVADGAALKN